MRKSSVETIVRALNAAGVQYLIVGGLAVVAHGYVRLTMDVDLLVGFGEANLTAAIGVFRSLGYRPRAPVAIEQFANAQMREEWRRSKGMEVFTLVSETDPLTEVDLFVSDPIGFARAYGEAVRVEIEPGVPATFCSLRDLLAMKDAAGRPRDRLDAAQLRQINGVP